MFSLILSFNAVGCDIYPWRGMVVDEHISHFFIWSIKACIYTGEEPLSLYIYTTLGNLCVLRVYLGWGNIKIVPRRNCVCSFQGLCLFRVWWSHGREALTKDKQQNNKYIFPVQSLTVLGVMAMNHACPFETPHSQISHSEKVSDLAAWFEIL